MRHQYVAMFETGQKGQNFFRFAYLEIPEGYMVPPVIKIGIPKLSGSMADFVYAPDQAWMAKVFRTSQQNISRWMKNVDPASSPQTKEKGNRI
jgi:hypothetical protein